MLDFANIVPRGRIVQHAKQNTPKMQNNSRRDGLQQSRIQKHAENEASFLSLYHRARLVGKVIFASTSRQISKLVKQSMVLKNPKKLKNEANCISSFEKS